MLLVGRANALETEEERTNSFTPIRDSCTQHRQITTIELIPMYFLLAHDSSNS